MDETIKIAAEQVSMMSLFCRWRASFVFNITFQEDFEFSRLIFVIMSCRVVTVSLGTRWQFAGWIQDFLPRTLT